MEIKLYRELSDENLSKYLEWANSGGDELIYRFAGPGTNCPLTIDDIQPERDKYYSIYLANETIQFVGVIELIRYTDTNAHVGRFLLDPDLTGKGIGTAALTAMCNHLRDNLGFKTASLNVTDYNTRAIKCYTKCGFSIDDSADNLPPGGIRMTKALI